MNFESAERKPPEQESFQVAGLLDFWRKPSGSDARTELDKAPAPESKLKDGDIIFHTSKSDQGEAIRLGTNSPLSHVGVLFKENGKWMVYEAVQPVRKTPLPQFAKNGEAGKYVVRRLENEAVLDEAALKDMKKYMSQHLGKNYDAKFGWGDDKMYCSELVWKAYERATGKHLGELRPMKDYDFSKPEVREKVKQRWGNNIPWNEKMIAPSDIYASKLLKTVR